MDGGLASMTGRYFSMHSRAMSAASFLSRSAIALIRFRISSDIRTLRLAVRGVNSLATRPKLGRRCHSRNGESATQRNAMRCVAWFGLRAIPMRRTRTKSRSEAVKFAADGHFVPGVKRQVVFGPNTRDGLPRPNQGGIRRGVSAEPPVTAILPKLENGFHVRIDDGTRARLEQLLARRARAGLRLSIADLAREAILRHLDREEAKVKPKPMEAA